MAGMKGRKKRFWSEDEKRSICAQARAVGVTVAQVARRYSMNANLIHKWLRDPRFGAAADVLSDTVTELEADAVSFIPVELEEAEPAPSVSSGLPVLSAPPCAQRIDITLSDGRRVLIEGSTALSAIVSLVEGLIR